MNKEEKGISFEKCLTENEIQLFENIGIKIKGIIFNVEEVLQIAKLGREKYLDTTISYEEADKYRDLYFKFRNIDIKKVDFDKVSKHSKEEFEKDWCIYQNIFDACVWSSPKRYEANMKNQGKEIDAKKYKELEDRNKASGNRLNNYTKELEKKYGNIDGAISWYNVI